MARRSGGRDARRAARTGAVVESAPFLNRQIPPRVMISDEGLEIIEYNADRILAEDRGSTNPLASYVPKIGDKLISEDMKLFEITAMAEEGRIIEFTGLQEPVRVYVAKDDIPSYFQAILGRNPN